MSIQRMLWGIGLCFVLAQAHVQGQQRPYGFATEYVPTIKDEDVLPVQALQPPRPPSPTQPAPYSRLPPPPPPPERATPAAATTTTPPDRTQVSTLPESTHPELLGDAPPLNLLIRTPQGLVLVPRTRGFKIDDNENPRPQTRTYFTFNQFMNLNAAVNERYGTNVHDINLHRETFGAEFAFCDECMSIGVRLPATTVSSRSSTLGSLNSTRTTWGDMSFILKRVLYDDEEEDTESVLSGGIAVTPPTGAGSLYGDTQYARFRNTTLQPYIGYIVRHDDLCIQGFSAIDISTNRNDVTIWYNDISVRYFLYWNPNRNAPITAITPIFEIHINTPLNHRGVLDGDDPAGTPDLVNLTMGVDFRFFDRAKLVLGIVTPVTGPKQMDYEMLSQFKLMF